MNAIRIRINILVLAGIGAGLVSLLALLTTGEAQLATLAVAGTLVGGLGGTMTRLSEPDPDPSVPASIVQRLLGPHSPPDLATIGEGLSASPFRPNVLLLAIIGAFIVGGMAFVVSNEAAIVTVAGGFVGGIVAIAAKLTDPPPNPSVPASVVAKIIEVRGAA